MLEKISLSNIINYYNFISNLCKQIKTQKTRHLHFTRIKPIKIYLLKGIKTGKGNQFKMILNLQQKKVLIHLTQIQVILLFIFLQEEAKRKSFEDNLVTLKKNSEDSTFLKNSNSYEIRNNIINCNTREDKCEIFKVLQEEARLGCENKNNNILYEKSNNKDKEKKDNSMDIKTESKKSNVCCDYTDKFCLVF